MMSFLGWKDTNWATKLVSEIQLYLIIGFALVGAVATIYAIYLGFLIAKAEDEGKRKEAKSRIFKTLVGIFIIVVLSTFFIGNPPLIVSSGLLDGVTDRGFEGGEDDDGGPVTGNRWCPDCRTAYDGEHNCPIVRHNTNAKIVLNIKGLSVTIVEK